MSHQLVNQTSGLVEYYTQRQFIESARATMGSIDLDPASCGEANQRVKAAHYFTKEIDGLSQAWFGNVWMNHPFHRGEKPCHKDRNKCKKQACKKRGYHIDQEIPSNAHWINKLISEYKSGNIKQATIITFASTSETWFLPLLKFPQCFPFGRVQYHEPGGGIASSVTKGSVITYIGPHTDNFFLNFSPLGEIKTAYQQG